MRVGYINFMNVKNSFHASIRLINTKVLGALLFSACATLPAFAAESKSDNLDAAKIVKPSSQVLENSILPSSLVDYLHLQNYLQPDWKQHEIAVPLLPLAQKENLDDHEEFYLAQLYYMAFKAQDAYDRYEKFIKREDWYGGVARQRQAIMDTRAFENFDRLESKLKFERENFPFDHEYAAVTGFAERSLCSRWGKQKNHEKAVKFAIETVNETPRNAPYGTLYAVGYCYKSFVALGRDKEAFALAQKIRDDLTINLKLRKETSEQYIAYDPDLFENQTQDRWYGRSEIAPYNYLIFKEEEIIQWYDRFLLCNRDRVFGACPT